MERMYRPNDQSEMRFFQVPKQLIENPIYSKLSIGAKMVYSVMRDRQDLSIANEWLDKNGFIYFYYDGEKLADYLNVSVRSIQNYKKELMNHELLIQKRQGQGKPNRMYILKPVSVDNALIGKNCTSRNEHFAHLKMQIMHTNDTKTNETNKSDTEYLHSFGERTCALLEYLNDYSLSVFGKQIRKHVYKEYDLDYLFEAIETKGYEEVISMLVDKYDHCNLDYLATVQERIV